MTSQKLTEEQRSWLADWETRCAATVAQLVDEARRVLEHTGGHMAHAAYLIARGYVDRLEAKNRDQAEGMVACLAWLAVEHAANTTGGA